MSKYIDLIIPCYKAKDTLLRLLSSVLVQSINKYINIIIVQDCDNENYSDIISLFDGLLDIEIISTEYNIGPGGARRVGTKHGKSKYIMYMDADDTFQNPFAAQELYNYIEDGGFDAVNSVFLEQSNPSSDLFISHFDDWIWTFGKIYRRSFLEKNNIQMNDSRANEDTGFNSVIRAIGNVGYLPDVTYIWYYKEDSITRKDNNIYDFIGLEGWLYNMEWAINELVRLNLDNEKILKFVSDNIIATYAWFLGFINKNDSRFDIEKYKQWVNKYYKNIYKKYTPTSENLNESFCNQCNNNNNLSGIIPKYTFEQYLYMVGEGYGK